MKSLLSRAALASVLMGASVMAMAATPAPEGAKVSIISPADGATVDKTFTVKFGVEGIQLAPAGDQTPNTGHHHLLIDTDPGPPDQPIPSDYNNIHLGNGQTEVVVTLPKGTHTLQLLLGDHLHMPHRPPVMSQKITIYVR